MKQPFYILLLLMIFLYMFGCAPASHVRTGVKMNVPTAWQGDYPYVPPDSIVHMGRPAPETTP
jgi:hypothetical protein